MKMETRKINGDPGVYCDACDEPCRSHFVKQCPQCGKYVCLSPRCLDHPCQTEPAGEVRLRMPRFVHLNSRKDGIVI